MNPMISVEIQPTTARYSMHSVVACLMSLSCRTGVSLVNISYTSYLNSFIN